MPGIVTKPNAPKMLTDERVRVMDGFVIETSVGRLSSGMVADLPFDELIEMDKRSPLFVRGHFESPGVARTEYPSGFTAADYVYDGESREFTPKPRVDTKTGLTVTPPPARVFWARAAPKPLSLNEPGLPWDAAGASRGFQSARGY